MAELLRIFIITRSMRSYRMWKSKITCELLVYFLDLYRNYAKIEKKSFELLQALKDGCNMEAV